MAINNNRDKQRTRVVYVPVNTGGGSGGGSQEKIKVGENGLKFSNSTFTEIPQIFDFSDMTDMRYMFQYCSNLTTIAGIDTSNVTTMEYMFRSCSSLANISDMDTSNVTSMYYMFGYCSSLTTVPEMDVSNVTEMGYIFRGSSSLTDLGGFTGLQCNLDLSPCSKLTHTSLINIINKASDVTEAPKTLTLGSTNLAKLSDEEKAIATAKGWTLA